MRIRTCSPIGRRACSIVLVIVLLTGAALATPTARAAGLTTTPICAKAGGYLLLQPRSAAGAAKAGLIVVDPASGDETGRITVPPVDAAFPTALPGRALAIAGEKLLLIDAADRDATEISLDASAAELTPNPVQFRGSAGTRYMLLGSPSFDRVVLVDVEAGTAANLTELIDSPSPDAPVLIQFAAVTPDDAHVVLWDGTHIYVVATDNPTAARRIDPGAFAFAPAFSPDASELVYSISNGPSSGSTLVSESIDGGDVTRLRKSDGAQVTLWVPQSRTIFIDERTETGAAAGTVSLFDLDSGDETKLTSYDGSLTTVQLSPDGKHALLGIELNGNADWQLADLTAGTVESLPPLGAGKTYPGLYGNARWSIFLPMSNDSSGAVGNGPAFRGIDLNTGNVGRLLDIKSPWQFAQPPLVTPNGRYALITGTSGKREKIWLVDAMQLQTTTLTEAEQASALFSPDSCYVALTTQVSIDGLPASTTKIVPVSGEKSRDAGNGTALVWVPGAS